MTRTTRAAGACAVALSGLLILAACAGSDDKSASSAIPAATKAAPVPDGTVPQAAPGPEAASPDATAVPQAASPAPAAAPTPAAARATGASAPRPGATTAAKPGAAAAAPAPNGAKPGAALPGPGEGKPGATAAPAPTPAPTGGGGGASDSGVTDSEIRLGTINMEGMAGGNYLIGPIVRTIQGAAESINDRGGIHGRKLKIFSCDDGPGDATRAKACLKKLVEEDKIFSMLSSTTWSSSALHSDLAKYQMPLVGAWAYANSEWEDPFMFPTHMSMYHEAHNLGIWVRDVIKPKTFGMICLNSPEMQKSCQNARDVLEPTGAKMVRKSDVEISTPDMSAEVLGFRAAAPDVIVHFAIHPAPIVKFMVDARQQEYYPPRGVVGNHLAAEVIGSLMGEWPVGRWWTNTTYNLWGTDYMAMEKKYAPGNQGLRHHVTQLSFVGVNAFAEAARRAGPVLTRNGLMNELRTGGVFDTGPGLDQKFSWGPRKNARELGGRTEYMFKYTSTDTTSNDDGTPNGLRPDPDKFVLVDDID